MRSMLSSVIIIILGVHYCASLPLLRNAFEVTSLSSEKDALIKLSTSLGGPGWRIPWIFSNPVSTWYGVGTNSSGYVITLMLADNGLAGSIPTEIGKLKYLQSLQFPQNRITGTIPTELSALQSLLYLNLADNNLQGNLPSQMGSLLNLKEFNVAGNGLFGTLPSAIYTLTNLQFLSIAVNKFQSTLSSSIGNLSKLEYLYLESNSLYGQLPTALGSLTLLISISLNLNQFSGAFPSSLCQLSSLSAVKATNLTVCYPECLENAIMHSSASGLDSAVRCQDQQDLVLCGMAPAIKSAALRQTSQFSVQLASNHPFNQVVHDNIYTDNPQFLAKLPTHHGDIYSMTLSFHSWTEVGSSTFSVCAPAGECKTWTNGLPGVGDTPSYNFIGSVANITFTAASCDGYVFYGLECWGYELDVVVHYYSAVGWDCTNPSPLAEMPLVDYSYSDFGITQDTSLADGRCWWSGITCSSGKITEISLPNWNIESTIPSYLELMEYLFYLDLSFNDYYGQIPTELSGVTNLVELNLQSNVLTGSLPAWLSSLEYVNIVDLSGNKLSGNIPDDYGHMESTMFSLDISSNLLTGVVSNNLCGMLNITQLYLASNAFDCYESCWFNATNIDVSLTYADNHCSGPSSPSSSASTTVLFNLLYLIPIIVGTVAIVFLVVRFCLIPKDIKVYQEEMKKRSVALANLPLHSAILLGRSPDDIVSLVHKHSEHLHVKDFDGKTPIDWALEKHVDSKIISAILEYSLPVNRDKTMVSPSIHQYCWIRVVQESRYAPVVESIMNDYGEIAQELATTEDFEGRPAVSIASPACQNIIKLRTFFHSRYEILTLTAPFHVSKTCVVHVAIDHKSEDKMQVAMKFMNVREAFLLEQRARQEGGFDPEFIVGIIRCHDSEVDVDYAKEAVRYGFLSYPDCIVMELAERNLQTICRSERISGDLQQVKLIISRLLRAVQHMHNCGYIHGDVKPLNIVRIHDKIKLIDLDAAARIGSEFAGSKLSTAYMPPELIHIADTYVILKRDATMNSPMRNQQMSPSTKQIMEVSSTKSESPIPSLALGVNFVAASPSYDVWSLGVVIYELCAGITLFWQDNDDNIDEEGLREVSQFDSEIKSRKLSKIPDKLARNMVHQMLTLDPHHRPTINQILAHPFLTGNVAARLVGETPEFDVFISYRVASDSKHASLIYELLSSKGLKVWWDRKCLKPGLSWEAGFCDGLAKSRVFLPILSRGAINHPTNPKQNFSKLTNSSTCDNVLLEYQLALELREHGLIERIYPVMVGDLVVDSDDTNSMGSYANYFASDCHPRFTSEVIVSSVLSNLCLHLNRQCLGTPLLENMSVSMVLSEITKNQGIAIEGPVQSAFNRLVPEVAAMLGELATQSSPQKNDGDNKV